MNARTWLAGACLLAALGVAAGAFGAHALKEGLEARGQLENWHAAVRYQVWHALALIAFALWRERHPGNAVVGWLMLGGGLLFSGSIYLLALDVGRGVVWPFTPLGGGLMMGGWVAWAVQAWKARS